jgi:hypothetical protein
MEARSGLAGRSGRAVFHPQRADGPRLIERPIVISG